MCALFSGIAFHFVLLTNELRKDNSAAIPALKLHLTFAALAISLTSLTTDHVQFQLEGIKNIVSM